MTDAIYYHRFTPPTLEIIESGRQNSYITPGEQFNVVELDEEHAISAVVAQQDTSISRPDYMTYQADTTLVPGGHISLRLTPVPGLPAAAQNVLF